MGKREERHRQSKLIANREDTRIAGEIASLTGDVGRVGTLLRALLLSATKTKKRSTKQRFDLLHHGSGIRLHSAW